MVDRNDGPAEEREFKHSLEDEFERDLRANLRPRPAPAGFTERVLRSRQPVAEDGQHFSRSRFPRGRGSVRFAGIQPWLRWGAAACLLLTTGGVLQHEHERREAGERARQQVLLALRITGTALQDVRSKVEDPRSRPVVSGPEQ